MDVLLDRLWELANDGDKHDPAFSEPARVDRVNEAHMLWRTLEVLVASFHPRELGVGDPAFTKLLVCVRTVLRDPGYWIVPNDMQLSTEEHRSVFVYVTRVIVKLGNRGEREREAIVRDGIGDALARSLQPQGHQRQDAMAAATALQAFQTLALTPRNRPVLEAVGTVALCLEMMQLHELDMSVQSFGCKMLQQMVVEAECKDKVIQAGGLATVLNALQKFGKDLTVATSGVDVIFLLSLELDRHISRDEELAQLQLEIATCTVEVMRLHPHTSKVVVHGINLLHSLVLHTPVKSTMAPSSVWSLAEMATDAPSDETLNEFAEVLEAVVNDSACVASLRREISTPTAQESGQNRLQALREKISELKRCVNPPSVQRVADLVQSFVDLFQDALSDANHSPDVNKAKLIPPEDDDRVPQTIAISPTALADDDDEYPVANATPASSRSAQFDSFSHDISLSSETCTDDEQPSPLSSHTSDNQGFYNQFLNDGSSLAKPIEDSHSGPGREPLVSRDSIDQEESPTLLDIAMPSPNPSLKQEQSFFFKEDLGRRVISDASSATQWKDHCERIWRDYQKLSNSYSVLNDNYQIVQRRAKEQSNLLAIQNSRLGSQTQLHQQVLQRVRTLENELAAVKKQYQIEHQLRLAEATQSEKISLNLHEATQEIKLLNLQNSSASRELMEKEKLRVDYQLRASEVRQVRQKLELERDEAIIEVRVVRNEKLELARQLQACRREGLEALMMREDDVDARKPRIFSEALRPASPFASTRRAVCSNPSTPKHHRSFSSDSLPTSFVTTTATTWGRLDSNSQPSSNPHPEVIDRAEIESCLTAVYESLDASVEGNGVHLSTVRRFFLESGLVHPPSLVAADVDVILAKVLTQAHDNAKKTLVRKDYALAQVAPAQLSKIDVRRYRYFDQAAFNEAVTMVGMKRFPRLDLLSVLQNVVALYLHSYGRHLRSKSLGVTTSAETSGAPPAFSRSMSMCLSPSSSGAIQAVTCASVMRAILSGLALHIGRGDASEIENDTIGKRNHSSSMTESPRHSGGNKFKREDLVYSMLEMHGILSREQKPLTTIFDFYSSLHYQASKDELLGVNFDLLLNFAMDFEIIPSFMDRVSLKHMFSEVSGFIKTYFAMQRKVPFAADAETLKKAAFIIVVARVAIELFSAKVEYETPEKQITGLLQWLDNSIGREKIMRKASLPVVIKFSRKLYASKS